MYFFYWFERETDRQTSICCSTYLCIHWLILVCALTGFRIHNFGISGWCSDNWTTQPGPIHCVFFWVWATFSYFFLWQVILDYILGVVNNTLSHYSVTFPFSFLEVDYLAEFILQMLSFVVGIIWNLRAVLLA